MLLRTISACIQDCSEAPWPDPPLCSSDWCATAPLARTLDKKSPSAAKARRFPHRQTDLVAVTGMCPDRSCAKGATYSLQTVIRLQCSGFCRRDPYWQGLMLTKAYGCLRAILPCLELIHLQLHAAHRGASWASGQQLQRCPQEVHVQVPICIPAHIHTIGSDTDAHLRAQVNYLLSRAVVVQTVGSGSDTI